jgi:hypothetical protein
VVLVEGAGDKAIVEAWYKRFDIDADMCLKFPASASGILQEFLKAGVQFSELDEIVGFVDKLIGT